MTHYTLDDLNAWLMGQRQELDSAIWLHVQECAQCASLVEHDINGPRVDLPALTGTTLLLILVRPGLNDFPLCWPRSLCKWAQYSCARGTIIAVDTSTHQLAPRVDAAVRNLMLALVDELITENPAHSVQVGIGRGFVGVSGLVMGPISDELEAVLQSPPPAPGALHWFTGKDFR